MRLTISNYIVIALVTGLIALGGSSPDEDEISVEKVLSENVNEEYTPS